MGSLSWALFSLLHKLFSAKSQVDLPGTTALILTLEIFLFRTVVLLALLTYVGPAYCAPGTFDLVISIPDPSSFTAEQYSDLQSSLATAEARWERVITGYQQGIDLTGMTIYVVAGSDFAETNFPATTVQGGYTLSTFTSILINPDVIDDYAAWTGVGPSNPNPDYLGLNYLDDILAHEIGHALGIGVLWEDNNASVSSTGQYHGIHGVRAYRAEFDPTATFVPVEQAGSGGTIDQHWDQLMRSSFQEGNPDDPYSLSPLTGITDSQGRDFGMEVMTGAIDADYGQPFLSMTTIQSLRDLGFTVVPEPSGIVIAFLAMLTVGCRRRL